MFNRRFFNYKKLSVVILIFVTALLFISFVSANEDNQCNESQMIKKEGAIEVTHDNNNKEMSENPKDNTKTATYKGKSTTRNEKHETSTRLNTYYNSSHIILNATVKSDISVNEGYVIYKLNGVTIKNSNNKNVKVNVKNSKAVLTLPLSSYSKIFLNSEAIYSGSDNFDSSRDYQVNSNTNKENTVTTLNTGYNSTHIILHARVKSDTPVYTGFVIFKLNSLTLKDSSSQTYKVYVRDSEAKLSLPIKNYRKRYISAEAVYSGSAICSQSRVKVNEILDTRLVATISATTDKKEYYPGQNVLLNINIAHPETNDFTNGRVVFKLNGNTLTNSSGAVIARFNPDTTSISVKIPKGLKSNQVNITIVTEGDNYKKVTLSKTITLNPLKTEIIFDKFEIDNNNDCIIKANIKDTDGENVIGKTFMDFFVDGNKLRINGTSKVYTIINGEVNIKAPLDQYKKVSHTIQLSSRPTSAYEDCTSRVYNINLEEKYVTSVIIDTPYKAKNASISNLRVYVTYADNTILKNIDKGKVTLKLGSQTLTSNVKYGKAIISCTLPKNVGTYSIDVTYEGTGDLKDSSSTKKIILTSSAIKANESAILGNKNPKTDRISLKNGIPQLVYMTNHVWADENGTYTLTKSQLQEVFKQDSYSLYLNKYMSKYVVFRSTKDPDVYFVLRREKWNVIEKAVNKYRVAENVRVIPNNITVSLKGKQYTYGEVRAIQSTGYTCGPTAASVCTQSLRNYLCENTLANEFQTYKYRGTYARYIPNAMKKHNISAVYFYKNEFNTVLNKLAGGGYSLIFYGVNHYVSIIDISEDKSKVLVSNSYGNYELGGGKIPNGWVSVSVMKTKFSSDSFGGLVLTLDYKLSSNTKNTVNNLYNNFGTKWIRKNTKEELNV